MRQKKLLVIIVLVLLPLFFSCSTVPLTGRYQVNLVSDAEMQAMSYAQYDEFLETTEISKDKKNTAIVKKVGAKIQKSVEQFLAKEGLTHHLDGYNWEFNLVKSDQANAWCMPGGKVVIYEGILPITKNETGLAVVMGHEIAHAIAEHGNERVSQGLITQLGGIGLAVATKDNSAETQALWMATYGIGSQLGTLAYSRTHESEADYMGMIFMAMAAYNPEAAVDFWQRMSENKNGQAPPEFLSTHPSDATRINDIKLHLPEAMKYYRK